MRDLVFVDSPPAAGSPGAGRGRPGQPRPGANQTPTERQPNRGRQPGDPFVCVGCRETFPAEEEYHLGKVPQGRCGDCGRAKRREATAEWRAKQRGADYVLPEIKDRLSPVVDGSRMCLECGETKVVSLFYCDRTVSSGHQPVCILCRRAERVLKWSELSDEDRQRIQVRNWETWIWRYYRLTVSEYEAMLEAQGGVCAICKQPPVRRLCVDHDHSCCPGKRSCGRCVRKLLCHGCNFTIGGIERVGAVDPFAEYLASHPKTLVSV